MFILSHFPLQPSSCFMALDRMHCADSHAKIRTSLYVVPGIVWLIVATYDPSKIFFNFADCSLYYVFNVSLMSLF